MNKSLLIELISLHFNLDELKELCAAMHVHYEDLPGEGKRAKARELIDFCDRRGKITDLRRTLIEERPALRDRLLAIRYTKRKTDRRETAIKNTKGQSNSNGDRLVDFFLMINVEARTSGRAVKALFDKEYIKEVSAVFSDVDVVARGAIRKEELGAFLTGMMTRWRDVRDGETPTVESIDIWFVNGLLYPGKSPHHLSGPDAISAYIVIESYPKGGTKQLALEISREDSVEYVAVLALSSRIMVKVTAPDKHSFDKLIMEMIQGKYNSEVRLTRTLITVNDLQKER